MEYQYQHLSLLMTGVLVIAIEAPDMPARKRGGKTGDDEPDPEFPRIPAHLARLKLNMEQQDLVRYLLWQTREDRVRAGNDRSRRRAVQARYDHLLEEILTEAQRAALRRSKTGRDRDGAS